MEGGLVKGAVELLLLSEYVSMPSRAEDFRQDLYRSTGVVIPYEEFDGPWQIFRYAQGLRNLERRFGNGDAIVIRFTNLNTITTLIPLDRRTPVLWNGESHRIFEQTRKVGEVMLQLPKSFQLAKKA